MKQVGPGAGWQAPSGPSICPHCWMVNPGPFRLCSRCGAQMDSCLQESAGLRRTAPVQSPVPVGPRLSRLQRVLVAAFLAILALTYLIQLVPLERRFGGVAASRPHAGSEGP